MRIPIAKKIFDDLAVAGIERPQWQKLHCAYFTKGYLCIITQVPCPEEQIFKRFAQVFDLTYTRFLDLQKAEAQAREAKIEAALEKVRSRTMAMQRSAELAEVATVLFQQVKALGVPQWTCGFSIFEIDDKEFTWYPGGADGDILQPCKIPLTEHPVFISFNESRKRGDELFVYEKEGEYQADHYRYMMSLPGIRELLQNMLDAGLSFPTFKLITLLIFLTATWCSLPMSLFPKCMMFSNVSQKFLTKLIRDFLICKKRKHRQERLLSKHRLTGIRAEIASMRTTNDLERIQPLVWNELTTLGVPFTRCGVFIMDEENEQVDTFLSTPEGRSIASFTSNYSDVAVISEALPYWRKKEIYKAHWDEVTFLAQAQTLLKQGNITSTETYLTEHQPKDLYLHFLPFLQGILYVGNETPLKADELQLVQNLADAFSIAYARYDDFNKLESAKEQIENTLVNLKQTQAQLVQSEKMASLGELTAGIAHEIQNPLNFVNNFSEVNTELIAEMKDEIEKGNIEEVKAIANDIADNEQKINHHGKRADAIVKGMLQHSRSSTGVKEPSDINVLADEYLRLAYHGLRAKDKSFNATMKTDFDETIGKINIVPQDVGRSVLNLITNAFYAVSEKKKQNAEGYEPTVTVTTKRVNGKVEIRVADNGNGIPQKVLDKIFQPFFTTKPTGQGTGLGLSLSYDIVKAHNGELKVETREGEGSRFIISLPANNQK
jgi:signal transduction histidine kinase